MSFRIFVQRILIWTEQCLGELFKLVIVVFDELELVVEAQELLKGVRDLQMGQ